MIFCAGSDEFAQANAGILSPLPNMTLFNIITLVDPRRCLPQGLPTFLIGTLCGVGITLITASHRNPESAKIITTKRSDTPLPKTFQCTHISKTNTAGLGRARSEEQPIEGNPGTFPSDSGHTSHLLQRRSSIPARSDVEVETVQLHDLHELEDYLYLPKPGTDHEKMPQDGKTEAELHNHICWCNNTDPRATLTPLLKMISKYFNSLEHIPFNYDPDERFSEQELVVAGQEAQRIRESLKHASLSFAIRQGHCEFISSQIKDEDTIGWSFLKLAITSNQVEVVRLFATLSKLDDSLRHLGFEEAAYQGRVDIMELFMCDATVDVNGSSKTNPLKAAAAAGQVDAMTKLIQAGAELEARKPGSILKEQHHTPLIAAVTHNQARAVTVLLDAGAMIDDQHAPDDAPLRLALKAYLAEIVDLLLQYGADADVLGLPDVWESTLELAVNQGHLELAKKALRAGANVNIPLGWFGTLLKRAVTLGDEQMTRLLMDHGADINYMGSADELGGNCALLAAASCRKTNIFEILLRHGALIEKASGMFGNVMQTVAHLGYAGHMKAILEFKPDIAVNDAACSRFPLSPLSMAVNYYLKVRSGKAKAVEGSDHVQLIRLLLAHKAEFE